MFSSSPTNPGARGYRRLADFMAWYPRAAIFPRFHALNLFNLLGLQAEIAQLEEEFDRIAEENNNCQDASSKKKEYSFSWLVLQEAEGGQSKQLLKTLELRKKLAEYNTALIQQLTLSQHPSPTQRDLHMLNSYLEGLHHGESQLLGPGSDIWSAQMGSGEYNVDDKLILSTTSGSQDGFAQSLTKGLRRIAPYLPLRHERYPSTLPYPTDFDYQVYSSNAQIRRFGDNLATIAAALLTCVPILALYFSSSYELRIGLVFLFTLLFASTLTFVSDARRIDVFAATAVFVAVQVVFIGSIDLHKSTKQ